jgi:hypothetical protein
MVQERLLVPKGRKDSAWGFNPGVIGLKRLRPNGAAGWFVADQMSNKLWITQSAAPTASPTPRSRGAIPTWRNTPILHHTLFEHEHSLSAVATAL